MTMWCGNSPYFSVPAPCNHVCLSHQLSPFPPWSFLLPLKPFMSFLSLLEEMLRHLFLPGVVRYIVLGRSPSRPALFRSLYSQEKTNFCNFLLRQQERVAVPSLHDLNRPTRLTHTFKRAMVLSCAVTGVTPSFLWSHWVRINERSACTEDKLSGLKKWYPQKS